LVYTGFVRLRINASASIRQHTESKGNEMNKPFNKVILVLLIASLFVFPSVGENGGVQAQDFHPPALEPSLSADGLTLHNGVPPPDRQG